ncbi:MAG TPA: hypothetical protein V6C85_19590 [Allocoleopsis sp.]
MGSLGSVSQDAIASRYYQKLGFSVLTPAPTPEAFKLIWSKMALLRNIQLGA